MAHGTEDQGDFLRVMADMGGFLHDFDHQDGVASGIKVGEGSEVKRQLVAEHQAHAAHGHHSCEPDSHDGMPGSEGATGRAISSDTLFLDVRRTPAAGQPSGVWRRE
jgi:hypothetical protein